MEKCTWRKSLIEPRTSVQKDFLRVLGKARKKKEGRSPLKGPLENPEGAFWLFSFVGDLGIRETGRFLRKLLWKPGKEVLLTYAVGDRLLSLAASSPTQTHRHSSPLVQFVTLIAVRSLAGVAPNHRKRIIAQHSLVCLLLQRAKTPRQNREVPAPSMRNWIRAEERKPHVQDVPSGNFRSRSSEARRPGPVPISSFAAKTLVLAAPLLVMTKGSRNSDEALDNPIHIREQP
ncbi:hypothetical protein VNO77_23036 [Canavalia gladiata]|uniref:Uncharacterized protein n=1 Tax=Canavalia gladiata TaxID=3824 RepID=A0AAN9L579_CANGL